MAHPQMTTTVGYGLGVCIALAKNGGKMSAKSLAGEVGASSRYMSQILNMLRTGRIVKSIKGRHGGYWLSRPANRITVGQIIKSIEEPPSSIPENIPPKVRRQLKRACRELYAIRLSEL